MSRTFTAHSSLGEVLQFRSLVGEERISNLFEFRVRLLSKRPSIAAKSLLGQEMSIEMDVSAPLSGPGTRFLSGQIVQFSDLGHEGDFYAYEALLRPWLWLATRRTDFKIFQHKPVPEIVQEVLAPYGYTVIDRLTERYRNWDYLVQYGESDFNFISRLLEHEGAYYYFEHEQGRHALVLADGIGSHGPLPSGLPHVAWRGEAGAGQVHDEDIIDRWGVAEDIASGTFASDDYDFTQPKAFLDTQKQFRPGHHEDDREIYAWPGGYTAPGDGETYARVRLEQEQALREVMFAEGNARHLAPGYFFDLTDHPHPEHNQSYLLLSARYQFEENLRRSDGPGSGHRGSSTKYRVRVEAVPKRVPWRSPRHTPKPRTNGPQTAVVTGPASEEIYTDLYGRVKVQFHWDRYGQYDEHSSCWIRVSQSWAGSGYGSMHIPRIGQEVIVDFLNGDPDYPIITGRVYNAMQMPPWELPANKTQSGIKTRSSQGGLAGDGKGDSPGTANALLFEDKAGAEQLWLHAQKDQLSEVENDEDKWVGQDRRKTIDRDEFSTIHRDRTEVVDRHEKITIGENRTRVVHQDDKLLVGGDRHSAITNTYTIEAGQKIQLVCGQTLLEMTAGGQVNLLCTNFNITAQSNGEINTPGGVLDLNIGGGSKLAIPAGLGNLASIQSQVGSHFSTADAAALQAPGSTQATASGSSGIAGAEAGAAAAQATAKQAKRERWECRKGQMAASREKIDTLPDGAEKDQLQAATERFARNNVAVEHARLSQAVYHPDPSNPDNAPLGWVPASPERLQQYGLDPKDFHNPDANSNFRAQLYEPDPAVFGDDLKPTVSFKGTQMTELEDWKNNLAQGGDFHSDYYENAVKIGSRIERSGLLFDITGHSLGGGLASAASQASGMSATTFNAAGLHANTVNRYGGSAHETDIQAYRIKGEILTGIQEPGWGGTVAAAAVGFRFGGITGALAGAAARLGLAALAPDAAGTPRELEGKGGPIDRHGIDQVINSIEGQKSEDQKILESSTGKTCPK